MALNSNIEEEEMKTLGFKTALFIDVPNWKKDKNTNKLNNEVISAGNTPDQNKLNEFNKSLISNLISQDLLKKLEAESPSKFDEDPFDYFENQHLYSSKLSFDEENEEDIEDSETKVSKRSKVSKDSNSSSEKTNDRKSNSLHIMPISKDKRFDFTKKYPSSMDNHQQFLESKEDRDIPFCAFNNQENINSNSK